LEYKGQPMGPNFGDWIVRSIRGGGGGLRKVTKVGGRRGYVGGGKSHDPPWYGVKTVEERRLRCVIRENLQGEGG